MPLFRNHISRRDAILVLLGASTMYILSTFFSPFTSGDIVINTHLSHVASPPFARPAADLNHDSTPPKHPPKQPSPEIMSYSPLASPFDIALAESLPETSIFSHAPGWTIFQDLYMAEGTLFIVSRQLPSYFPPIRMMISTPIAAENTPENIKMREPTSKILDIISLKEAHERWGGDVERGERNRVWSIEGNTFLVNDPGQFLRHYYHFVAELLFGAWAFWSGSFSPVGSVTSDKDIAPPPIHRVIFAKAKADEWRDSPGFNAYFFRAAFPSITIEHENDWIDRVLATTPPPSQHSDSDPSPVLSSAQRRPFSRAWHFPLVFVADRSAAFRGKSCGSRTQRTASEALEFVSGAERLSKRWWDVIRTSVARFAGVEGADSQPKSIDGGELTIPEKIVITYISRQGTKRRCLLEKHHKMLVHALTELVKRKNAESGKEDGKVKGREWELNVIQAETLTKDEQVRIVARTTILLGVHGNGLTHLVLMSPSKLSTVIEIFFPGGFAHDYEWTTRALGMKHFAFWNDTHHTYPNEPQVSYPEGFQGDSIPVYGPAVAQLIEDRVEGIV